MSEFVRKHRVMCASILKQRAAQSAPSQHSSACGGANKRTSSNHVYMMEVLMAEDDADDPCDGYFAIGKFFFLSGV